MNKEQWKRISRMMDVALTLPQHRRSTYIQELCGGDPELLEEMTQMMHSLEESEGLLEDYLEKNDKLIDKFITRLNQKRPDPDSGVYPEGHIIGQWKLISLLGHGGMGSVYKAERIDPDISQTGALKILHRHLRTPQHTGRFRLEQQILASLHHPNIASLIEGGVSEEGLPWMVMEYVKGKPLLEYCDEHLLSIRQRLDLFLTVCEAVEYAHKNLVIHRDLKPENILVTPEGHVKILDFGIAKLLDPDIYDLPIAETLAKMQPMSLGYAAPEQISGDPVTIATDIYALGILLYELLAGMHPFDIQETSFREMARIIRENEPRCPSRRYSGYEDRSKLEKIAGCRSVDPGKLKKQLSGDPDAIILKAIRKEPDDRYDSVGRLKEDILLYLQHKPVSARGEAVQYRVKKFIHRYKWRVTAVTAILISLIGGLGIALWQAQIAATERDHARTEQEKAEEITDFMLGLFEAGDPAEARGDTLTARTLLHRGAERAETLNLQPEVQTEMLGVIGRAYHNLALYNEAESIFTRALQTSRRTYGEAHSEVANNLRNLANLYQDQGHYRDADSLYSRALAMQKMVLSNDHPEIAETLSRMAGNRIHMSRDSTGLQTAESELREALAIHRNHFGGEDPRVAEDLRLLSRIMYYQGDRTAQENLLREALEIQRTQLGEGHPEVAETKEWLATALYNAGRYEEAEALHREVLSIRSGIFGETHPAVGLSLNGIALAVGAQGNHELAAGYFEKAVENYRKAYGENSTNVANLLNNASQAYMDTGEYDRAKAMQLEALEIYIDQNGPNSPLASNSYYYLSLTSRQQGNLDEAEEWIRKSIPVNQRLGHDLYAAWDLFQLALIEEDRQKYTAAEKYRKEGMEFIAGAVSEDHHHMAAALHGLARVYIHQNRYEEAEPLLREALAIRTEQFGDDDMDTARTKSLLGKCLTAMAQYREAERLLTEGYETLKMIDKPDARQKILRRLVALYETWEKPVQVDRFHALLEEK